MVNILTMFSCIWWLRVSYLKFFKQSEWKKAFANKCHISICFTNRCNNEPIIKSFNCQEVWFFLGQILLHCSFTVFSLYSEALLFHSANNISSRPLLLFPVSMHLSIPSRILFFAEVKSTPLLWRCLGLLQVNFLNLLFFMISRSPVKICTWSLSMKGDLAQSDGGNYRLETTESKVNILERIGFLRV